MTGAVVIAELVGAFWSGSLSLAADRSEERRVGKECRSGGGAGD